MAEALRLAARRALAVVTPSRLSRCLHCFTPWGRVGEDSHGHTVMYSETSGLMVVCELCWPLTTVEERVEYARQWVLMVWRDGTDWPQIERAYRGATDEPIEPCGDDIGVTSPRRCVLPKGHGGDWHDDGSACWSTSLEPVESPEDQERSEEKEHG
jgi:hypothetical protein